MIRRSTALSWSSVGVLLLAALSGSAQQIALKQTNLVTDDPTVNPAVITDPSLKNAWGISFSPASPFWVSDNATGVSTLYAVNPTTNIPVKQGLTVNIPGNGSVTGQAFNGNGGFNGDIFLFVSEDGTVSGWRGALGTNAETLQTGSSNNVYKGTTTAVVGGNTYLYAANFHAGTIDVLKGNAGAPNLTGNFADPALPAGYAPFNIQRLGNRLYVTYALQDAAMHDDVPGVGNGFVSAFDLNGNFLGRVGSQGLLNSPWGLAIAPSNFGMYAGDLLVGNFGDGHINAFDPLTNSFIGQLHDPDNNLIAIDGLWALTPGNNGNGGSSSLLYFSAGPGDESHGLFGSLQAVPEPGNVAMLFGASLPAAAFLWRRRRKK